MLEIWSSAVRCRLSSASGFRPAEGGTYGTNTIPSERMSDGFICVSDLAIDHFWRSQAGLMRENEIRGSFYVEKTPAEFVVRSCGADVVRGFNHECLEHAGTHP